MTARLERSDFALGGGFLGLAVVIGSLAGGAPKLAVGIALSVAFVLLAFSNLPVALALFTCEPFGIGVEESTIFRTGAVVLLLAWLGVAWTRGEGRRDFITDHPAMTGVIGALFGWVLLSFTWAEDTGETWIALGRFSAGILMFLVVYTAVTNYRTAAFVTGAFLAGAVGAALYGYLSPQQDLESTSRLAGKFFDPNELAFTLVAALAFAGGLATAARRAEARFAAAVGGVLALVGILLTVSRGGLVALAFALLAGVLFSGRWRPRVALAGVALVASATLYFAALAPQDARQRITESSQGQTRLLEGRTTIWQVGWRMVEANSLKGVGAGNFKSSAKHYLLRPGAVADSSEIIATPKVAHNIYLELLAELGIVGLLLFLILVGFSLRSALRAARSFSEKDDRRGEALARACAVALVGMLAAAFFISQEYDKQLWLVMGLGPALLTVSGGMGASTGSKGP